jgi:hypothetical protein
MQLIKDDKNISIFGGIFGIWQNPVISIKAE